MNVIVYCILTYSSFTLNTGTVQSGPAETTHYCYRNQVILGFQLRYGSDEETDNPPYINGVKLQCGEPSSLDKSQFLTVELIEPYVSTEYAELKTCINGFGLEYRVRVYKNRVTNLDITCAEIPSGNRRTLRGSGPSRGKWSPYTKCSEYDILCGVQYVSSGKSHDYICSSMCCAISYCVMIQFY